MGSKRLLDWIARVRMENVMGGLLENSREYQQALKGQDEALKKMEEAVEGMEQRKMVDRAISAANYCGAVYSTMAYKQGFRDGVKLMSELKKGA